MDRSVRKQYWTEQLSDFRKSKSTRVAFCRERGYSTWTLKYWEKQFGGASDVDPVLKKQKTFAAVEVRANKALAVPAVSISSVHIRIAGIEIQTSFLPNPEWLIEVASRLPATERV